MRPEIASLLLDIRNACSDVIELTQGKLFNDYLAEKYTRAAAERLLTIIGEATVRMERVPASERPLIPEVAQIVAFRNRLVHGYDVVDHFLVWGIVRKHVPLLLEAVSRLLDEWYAEHPQE
jgi:uncharacterized protein with HEPN domain